MQKFFFFSQKYIQLLNLEPSVPLHGAFVRHVHLPQISPERFPASLVSSLWIQVRGLLLPLSTSAPLGLHVTQG